MLKLTLESRLKAFRSFLIIGSLTNAGLNCSFIGGWKKNYGRISTFTACSPDGPWNSTNPRNQKSQSRNSHSPANATESHIKSWMTMAHCKFLFMLDTCMSQRQQQKRTKALWNISLAIQVLSLSNSRLHTRGGVQRNRREYYARTRREGSNLAIAKTRIKDLLILTSSTLLSHLLME